MEKDKWVKVGDCDMRLREDGKVDVYSPSGYRVLEFEELTDAAKAALLERE